MANNYDNDSANGSQLIRHLNKMRILRVIIASMLAVVSIVVLIVVAFKLNAATFILDESGRKGHVYKGVTDCMIMLALYLFGSLLLYIELELLHNKVGAVMKILRAVLHVVGVFVLTVSLVGGSFFYGGNVYVEKFGVWTLAVCGMGPLGVILTLLTYYWNERLMRGPSGASKDYVLDNYILQVDRAAAFKVVYIGVPYVALIIGYFISVVFAYLGSKSIFFYGFVNYIIAVIALVASIVVYRLKHRMKGRARKYASSATSNNSSGTSSSNKYSNNYASSASDESKPVDNGYAEGKKLLSNELFAYNDLKFIPFSYDWPNLVSGVRWTQALELDNKQTCFISERIIVRGGLSFQIKREAMYPNDSANEILEKTIDNIQNKVRELLDELDDKYSNYNKNFTIDCSRIKISYKII